MSIVCRTLLRFRRANTVPVSQYRSIHTPRRAVFYAPGDDLKKVTKASGLKLDCLVLDCEDAVAANRKAQARETIRNALSTIDIRPSECAVRVNSTTTDWMSDDIASVVSSPVLPDTVFLPKVDSRADLDIFYQVFNKHLSKSPRASEIQKSKLNLVIYAETAKGLVNLPDICQHARSLFLDSPFTLSGVVFGGEDYCADSGASRSPDNIELLYARQRIVAITRAFGLHSTDVVHLDFHDLESLRKESLQGASFGFTGKQVIHPKQVAVVQEAFSPSPERVEWAEQLVAAFEHHQESGKGAFTFRGQMIDLPMYLKAKDILRIAEIDKAFSSP